MALKAIPFYRVSIEDDLWKKRMQTMSTVTLPDCLDKCEATGRIANFRRAAGMEEGEFEGIYYNDSDVYKVLEGIGYSLRTVKDAALEARADAVIDAIAAAQRADGYLQTYFQLKAVGQEWTDMEKHEMYCAGHLIEAAVVYYQSTGKDKLLQVACRLADYFCTLFGEGKRHWVPGHEEIELALIRLYDLTGKADYLTLARFLLEERGHGHGRGRIWTDPQFGEEYAQDDVPVRDMRRVKGHAVRAMYLYTAMADSMRSGSGVDYMPALLAVHEHLTGHHMYLTGGIGSSGSNEGFTVDDDLPNETAYCETCASVGMVYWNHRMNLITQESGYCDVLERALYNGVLSGYGLSGREFFYDNPLSSDASKKRSPWFDCSCCPTQLARFIPSVGEYLYAQKEQRLYVNLYCASRVEAELEEGKVALAVRTNYPWSGTVEISVEQAEKAFVLCLRRPQWCRSLSLRVNGRPAKAQMDGQGYLCLEGITAGDRVELEMDMPARLVHAHARVAADAGKVAVMRGPLVYCAEEIDQTAPWDQLRIGEDSRFLCEDRPELLGGVTVIRTVHPDRPDVTLVPYQVWNNRGTGRMDVWLPEEDPEKLKDRLYN